MITTVLVCGSRSWTDRDMIHTDLDGLLADEGEIVIVHGAAIAGADAMAALWCHKRKGPKVTERRFPADWSLGKSAGYRRNAEMATKSGAHHCLAYWDGKSNGTLDMIQRCIRAGIDVTISAPRKG